MARQTRIEFSDDIDGKVIDVDDIQIVAWSWLGVDYEFDTSTANLERIETGRVPLSTLLEKSRRVGGRRRVGTGAKGAASADNASSSTPRSSADQTRAVRDWARKNGLEVSDRGRIPAAISEAFAAAH